MAHFDERSGIIPCKTDFGSWWQTIDEVNIEIISNEDLKSKEIQCKIKPSSLFLAIRGTTLIEGDLFETVHADEAVWTLENKRNLLICLPKSHNTASHCWNSLLKGKYAADPFTYDEMQKKLTLQRFQLENPGMDFSGAMLTGNYQCGGPEMPDYSSSK